MVDSPSSTRTSSVPEIKPLDQYDFDRAKTCASVRWLLSKWFGSAENVPVEFLDPVYKDQHGQEHLKPGVSKLLLSSEIYCRVQSLLVQTHRASGSQASPSDSSALLQYLTKKGLSPKVQDVDVTEEDLSRVPIKTKSHVALIDSLMSLSAKETVEQVKMAAEAEHMGVGAPWENALLFWVNLLNQRLRECTEDEEPPRSQTCTDLQSVKDTCQSNRWYWKLVPHAIAFCLKESGNKPPVIRYRKDKVQSKLTPTFPLVSAVKDLSNGCAVAAVLHFYCPSLLPLEDVCLKDTMSVADSLYNLQLIKDFCESRLQSCCPLAVEDLLYAPPLLHLNIMSFMAELLEWFEIRKPEFVQPLQPVDLTDVSELLDCTSPVSGNSNSGSPSFIFKQPFVPLSSVSPVSENKSWTKKQISRPLSAVTFSIPFGLDSDVDIVMGNPIDSVFRSVSTDNLPTGVPAITSSMTSSGMARVPYTPPEDLSHLVSSSAPSQRSSWGPYAHTAPLGELPTIEEALQVVHAPNGKDRKKARIPEKGGRGLGGGRPEPRLCPEGAPAGFFLHCPEEDSSQLSSSAPSRSGVLYRPVGGEVGGNERQGRGGRSERSGRRSDMSRDDDSVLRDGSVDSSDTSDDAPRNAPGNIRPSSGHHGNNSANNSTRMTSFAERRDNRRRHPATPGEESLSAPTPTTPGTPHTPSTPVKAPGPTGPEPGPEAWELGARLEEKRKSIEAQKRRIEAIFAKHRQRLGKTAFLQLKREKGGGGGGNGAEDDNLTLEERLTRMEEQLKQEEEKEVKEVKDDGKADDKESEKTNVSNPPRLEKQVTFSIDSKKEPEKEKPGESVLEDYNEVVQKLGEALQSLQRDMQKLTEQQQQLLGNQRPRNSHKTTLKPKQRSNVKTPPQTPPHTPTKTPPRTPTKAPTRSSTKAWVIPAAPHLPTSSSPSRRSNVLSLSTSPKSTISSSCPAPRTKIHAASSSPRSPKHHQRQQNQRLHPRPSDLKVPTSTRVLVPTQTVDTLQHLRRASPSKCQVQTSSSFHIGGPRIPQDSPQCPPQPDESTSETGSSETPTQFSLELEQEEEAEAVGGLPVSAVARHGGSRAGGSSSGAPSECSFESETFSISAAYSTGGGGARKSCNQMEASLSSLIGPEGGSDLPTDEGHEFSSDSMSDHTESAAEPGARLVPELFEPLEQPDHEAVNPKSPESPEEQTEPKSQTEPSEPNAELAEQGTRGGIGFFFKDELHNEEEMAQRRALLLERQQRRAEELKKRRQWNEQERENRSTLLDRNAASPPRTPPAATTSPSPTPPATPARRDDFTRGEYARRQQLRVMEDFDKVLRQKAPSQGRSPAKKSRARPRSMTREETKLSLSPAKGIIGAKLTKEYSHSSVNLAARDESGNNGRDSSKKGRSSRPESPSGCVTPNKLANQNLEKDSEAACNGSSSAQEYTGPKLFKEPSFKSNKFIIHNALSHCCLAGKVNEAQKTKIVEEMEKSPANHFLILFRDSSCQFRGVYTMNLDSQELVRLAGVGPRTVSSTQVESIYKYSSDRKQFSAIPSKTMGMSVDAFTIPGHLWHGGGGGAAGGGGGRRTSVAKKAVPSK